MKIEDIDTTQVDACGIPLQIVRAAMKDSDLDGRVYLCSTRREAIRCEGHVVGFVTPRQEEDGRWRHGPIYILPGFRRRGLLAAYYASHPERRCVAFVADTNPSSRSAHNVAGFKPFRRQRYGWFMRREPIA